jgi:hypothetical protein
MPYWPKNIKKAKCPYCYEGEIIMNDGYPSCDKCFKIIQLSIVNSQH